MIPLHVDLMVKQADTLHLMDLSDEAVAILHRLNGTPEARGTMAEAEQHVVQLEGKWKAYPSVSQVWRRNWGQITPFFNYPPDICKAIYTNSVESLNRWLRKIIKTRGGLTKRQH